jgi:hypothetical protein
VRRDAGESLDRRLLTVHMGNIKRAIGTTILTGRTVEGGVRSPVTLFHSLAGHAVTLQVGLIVLMASAVWLAQGTAQPLPPLTDSDAYAIYGVLLDTQLWRDRGDRPLFIVQETRLQPRCGSSRPFPQVWRTAQADMERQNARTWKLLNRFPTIIR